MLDFVCPYCKVVLTYSKEKYTCTACDRYFPIIDGIPVFIDIEQFEEEEKVYRETPLQMPSVSQKPLRSDSTGKLDFYIRSRPAEILIQRGYQNGTGLEIAVGSGKNENFEHIYNKVTKDLIGTEVSFTAARAFSMNFPDCKVILACDLPFNDETFDFITTSGVVHHIIGQPHNFLMASLREWFRVLKKGGLFISNDPNLLFPFSLMMHFPNRVLQRVKPGARGRVFYERPILFHELKDMLQKTGFRNASFDASTFAKSFFPSSVIKLIFAKEERFRKKTPYKYLGAWITVYAEK